MIWFSFAQAHVVRWYQTGDARGVGAIAIETVVAVMFLVRRAPMETSDRRGVDRNARRHVRAAPAPADGRQRRPGRFRHSTRRRGVRGVSLLAIGSSFGLVAANRGVRTGGPYALVRHPVYLGYFVTNVGYLLENPSLCNLAVMSGATLAQLVRISCEEEVLSSDEVYNHYRNRVRFRLIPYIY